MKKRVFLIHGWGGYPNDGWRPWLKEQLELKGFEVHTPPLPNTNYPNQDAWVDYVKQIVGNPDEQCYFVGHSLGAITILRFLETLEPQQKIGGAIFVAGFTDDLSITELRDSHFFIKPINWEKIKKHCKKFIAIHSTNDPYVNIQYGDIFKEKLGAEVVLIDNMKHFSGDDGITELPIVFESLLSLSV